MRFNGSGMGAIRRTAISSKTGWLGEAGAFCNAMFGRTLIDRIMELGLKAKMVPRAANTKLTTPKPTGTQSEIPGGRLYTLNQLLMPAEPKQKKAAP